MSFLKSGLTERQVIKYLSIFSCIGPVGESFRQFLSVCVSFCLWVGWFWLLSLEAECPILVLVLRAAFIYQRHTAGDPPLRTLCCGFDVSFQESERRPRGFRSRRDVMFLSTARSLRIGRRKT